MAVALRRPSHSLAVPDADLRKLMAISGALKIRDRYTDSHGRRVAVYARRLALRVGVPETEAAKIAMGGMLHDVGKIGMSDRIFSNQAAELSDDMLQEVRRHPIIGVMLLKDIDFLAPVLELILFHHERIDGTGYPLGLKGVDIPLGAQLISIADCFDAVTTDRPYQKHKGCLEAFKILRAAAEKAFAARLVEAFISDIQEKGMLTLAD